MKVPGHLQIEEVKLAAGQEWTDPAAAWRFVLVRRGAAYWLGRAENRPLTEGEMIVAPPGLIGTVRASQIGEVTLFAFDFAPDLLGGFLTLAERHLFDSGDLRDPDKARFLPSTHPATQRFAALAGAGGEHHNLAERAAVLGLAAAVLDEQTEQHPAPPPLGSTASERFEQLISRMPDTEMINHSPEELARLCGCSPRHFNRLYRQHFGTSAREHQTELRLLKARQLLSDPKARIAQAARECGFADLDLFNSLFQKRFGMTPSELRAAKA